MWPKFGYSSIFMRQVIITQMLYGFDQKNRYFEGWSWFRFNNLRLVLNKALKFYSNMAKRLKLKLRKCWGKLVGDLFALSPPPILNRIKNELADSRSVKTYKIQKNRFHCFIACSVQATCIVTVITLENMFGTLKLDFYSYGEIREEKMWCVCMFVNA